VYTQNEIDKDILPGDIFKRKGNYYLNIRPECDTTKRVDEDHMIYLIKGKPVKPNNTNISYDSKFGITERINQIILLFLDGKDIVIFNKRDLQLGKYSDWKEYKKWRLAPSIITQIRQSFSSYLGRYGIPSYPKKMIDSLFEQKESP
jgi:hypothetical protein